jgi:hypothetical protein
MERTLLEAIALSAGNKAITVNKMGERIIVQELVLSPQAQIEWCLHIWIINDERGVSESDILWRDIQKLKDVFLADPNAEVWTSL